MVASCWGFASPWPPSPLPDYFPNRWDAVSRVGCLSLGIDSPPFYGPPLCPSDPVLYPNRARRVSWTCRDFIFSLIFDLFGNKRTQGSAWIRIDPSCKRLSHPTLTDPCIVTGFPPERGRMLACSCSPLRRISSSHPRLIPFFSCLLCRPGPTADEAVVVDSGHQ